MATDPKTCTSEHVTFEVVQVPAVRHGSTTLVPALKMHCLTCEKWAMSVIEGFSESSVAQMWNAHHARQMAERIKQEEADNGAVQGG